MSFLSVYFMIVGAIMLPPLVFVGCSWLFDKLRAQDEEM